ncbi:MAG: hypothetical protein IPM57_11850 [Oligoflexia bacterium]|nr:hypothetical protein [Oligoflexia bacterium]
MLPCEIKSEKVITVGQKGLFQCLLNQDQKGGKHFEFQVLDAAEFTLQFLGDAQLKENILEQEFTSYKVGNYNFNKINLIIDGKSLPVSPMQFEVKTIITEPSPTPYPLISAQKIAAPWWWWVMWGLILVGSCVYGWIQFIKWKKRKFEEANRPKVKILTSFEKYKLNLQKLESQEFHLKGEYKRFALDLSQIIKKAIGEKLSFLADDLTTEELFETLEKKHKKFWVPVQGVMTNAFITLDQIKFAKTPATAEMCMALLDASRLIGDELYKDEVKVEAVQ